MRARSLAAGAAGVAVNLLAVPVDLGLHAAGVMPMGPTMGDGHYALALAYRAVLAVAGAWTVFKLAPCRPWLHVWTLAGLGALVGTLGAVAQLSLGHHWYPLSLIALCAPASWAGAKLAERS
jgi:hypothetical protein